VPRLILDTNVLLWAIDQPHRIPAEVLDVLADRDNDVFFSAASIWEIAIKASLGRPAFDIDAAAFAHDAVATGFAELPVTAAVAARVRELPPIHKDPFDRLLVAQAITEPARLLTSDRLLAGYTDLVEVFVPT